jgi:predicted Fe-Mo cluster-binding NifX family protein
VAKGFHNIEYVCVFDSSTEVYKWFETNEIIETPGGLNSVLTENGIFSIISLNISPMVLTMFKRNGIEVWKAKGTDLRENLRLFELSELKIFTADECRFAQSCNSSSCLSYGSTCI